MTDQQVARVIEAIDRHTGALDRLTAAIAQGAVAVHAGGPAVNNPTPGVRAGQPAMAQPIGTGSECRMQNDEFGTEVASSILLDKNQEERVDRSIDRAIELKRMRFSPEEIDCDEVDAICERIAKVVRAKPGTSWRRDRQLIVGAAALSTRLGQQWLDQALQATAFRRDLDNSAGYFTACLANGLYRLDPSIPAGEPGQPGAFELLRMVIRRMPIPEDWLAEPRRSDPVLTAREAARAAEVTAERDPWRPEHTEAARVALRTGQTESRRSA